MARKRGNGEGNIRQRSDGTWEGRYVAGYKADGTLDRKSIYGKRREDVQKRLQEIVRSIDSGDYVEPSKMTVAQWLETWINEYVKPTRKATTVGVYLDSIKNHIAPVVGRYKIQQLRTEHIQAMLNRMQEKGLKPATIVKAKNVLHGALNQAVKNRIIPRNVADGVEVKRDSETTMKPLTPEEQKAYAEALPNTTTGRALAFDLGTGLRVAELCGLRWQDVGKDSFKIAQTVRRVPTLDDSASQKTAIMATTPKTKNSRREIPLTPKTRAILDAQRKRQLSERLKCGDKWNDNDLVFTTAEGKPLDVRNVNRTHYETLDKIGAERRGVHHLRHTFATRAIEHGMDYRTLSEILGHSDVATTLRVYVHSSMETKTAAMQALSEFL